MNKYPFKQYYVYVYICIFHLSLIIVYVPQRQGKVQEIYLKCSKARNDYLLNLAAANASMNKYYLQDISTLIDVSASNSHPCVSAVFEYKHKQTLCITQGYDAPTSGALWTSQ